MNRKQPPFYREHMEQHFTSLMLKADYLFIKKYADEKISSSKSILTKYFSLLTNFPQVKFGVICKKNNSFIRFILIKYVLLKRSRCLEFKISEI